MIRTAAFVLFGSVSAAFAQSACDNLKSLKFPDTTILVSQSMAAGPYQAPGRGAGALAAPAAPAVVPPQQGKQAGGRAGGGAAPATPQMLPAYCRVDAILKPSPDSEIEMELWMPAGAAWNGKFQAVGGGGWAGTISFAAMATALQEGYATASTDTGHKGGNAQFALGHPEKIVDFGYRAIHDMTVHSKEIVKAFYGSPARLSYFNGCSTGGRQALMEAQRFPEDFDGIVAGAPANNHIMLHAAGVARSMDIMKIPGDHGLTPAKKASLAKAVLDACDGLDGVKDGLLNNPRKCSFSPDALLCKGADADACLTAPQIAAVKRTYADTKLENGQIVWTGYELGSENGLASIGTGTQLGGGLDSIRILGYQDPNWDWHTFDLDRDLAVANEKAGFINASSPDLNAFKANGGKLILYHGWSDPSIPPGNTIHYYNSVLQKMGAKQENFVRLYMMPGMQHCGGGPGPNQFSYMGAMERWRESNQPPEQLLGNHVANNRVDMSRPVCPFPQVAVYKGVGSTNDAANFACKVQ